MIKLKKLFYVSKVKVLLFISWFKLITLSNQGSVGILYDPCYV